MANQTTSDHGKISFIGVAKWETQSRLMREPLNNINIITSAMIP